MVNSQQYSLWFVNQSGKSGRVCLYQNTSNIVFSISDPEVLAWAVTGANPSVQVKFIWTINYYFAWFNYVLPSSLQLLPADLSTNNSIVLSYNQYGFYFQKPQSETVNQLLISEDDSLPSTNNNNAVVGIGMHGAGTFGYPIQPNQKLAFTPAETLSYWISFGQYTFEENDPLTISTLNEPGQIKFPSNVYTMTASLDETNSWTINAGKPAANFNTGKSTAEFVEPIKIIVYEVGKGIQST